MTDLSSVKLGKLPAVVDMRLPLFAGLQKDGTPDAPSAIDWTHGQPAPAMLSNTTVSNCTSCSMAHLIGTARYASGRGYWQPTDAQAIQEYSASCGYVPGQPATDQGGIEADVLAYFQKHGYCGYTIDGYARINLGDLESLRKSVWQLSGAYIGISLPLSAQSQDVWDVPKGGPRGAGEPNSWGGHATTISGYDKAKGLYYAQTWNIARKPMTEDFIHAYVDEAWAVALTAFLDKATHISPNLGLDRTALLDRMEALG